MLFLPQKSQWKKWSLPSKLTAIAFYITVITVVFSVTSYLSMKCRDYLTTLIEVKEVRVEYGEFKIRYPVINHFLSNKFLDEVNQDIQRSAISYLTEDLIEYNFDYEVGIDSSQLLTLKMEQYYYYYPSANGNASLLSININPSKGENIGFYDIFDPRRDALAEIKVLINKQLKSKNYPIFEDEFEKTSYIPRFFIKKDSIEFIFSEYEITPGYLGCHSISIAYKEILGLIDKSGPMGYLVPSTGSWEAGDYFNKGVMNAIDKINSENIKDTSSN